MAQHDWIVAGGRVMDPANRIDGQMDLCLRDGRISLLTRSAGAESSDQRFDARDCWWFPA